METTAPQERVYSKLMESFLLNTWKENQVILVNDEDAHTDCSILQRKKTSNLFCFHKTSNVLQYS